MELQELSNLIYAKCKSKGLCQKGTTQWDGSSKDSLLKMYAKEPEFIIQQKPISLYFIRDYFEKELLEENGIYILEDYIDLQIDKDKKDYVLNGCNGDITINSSDNIITISDNSSLRLIFNKAGFYTINIFDNSDINIDCTEDCKIVIFSYGNNDIEKPNVSRIKIINK